MYLIHHAAEHDSLDVVLIGKDDNPASVGGLHQSLDDFIKLPWSGLSWNPYGLCNTQPSCVTDQKKSSFIVCSVSMPTLGQL